MKNILQGGVIEYSQRYHTGDSPVTLRIGTNHGMSQYLTPNAVNQLFLDSIDPSNSQTHVLAREIGWGAFGETRLLHNLHEDIIAQPSSKSTAYLVAAAFSQTGDLYAVRTMGFLDIKASLYNTDPALATVVSGFGVTGIAAVRANLQGKGIGKDLINGLFCYGLGDMRALALRDPKLFVDLFVNEADRERFSSLGKDIEAWTNKMFGQEGIFPFRMSSAHGARMIDSVCRTLVELGVEINPVSPEPTINEALDHMIGKSVSRNVLFKYPEKTIDPNISMLNIENRSAIPELGSDYARIASLIAFIRDTANVTDDFLNALYDAADTNPDYDFSDVLGVAQAHGIKPDQISAAFTLQARRTMSLLIPALT